MLASEVLDQSAIFLNDTALTLYTHTVQLPYLKRASEDLEKKLIEFGQPIQLVEALAILVLANTFTVGLPTDFLLPISLKERFVGQTEDQWVDMVERDWEGDSTSNTYIEYWAFRNNLIYIKPPSVNKEILLKYNRALTVISSANSTIDTTLSKGYLAARTAELCARYIGMNDTLADKIAIREVNTAEDTLMRIFLLEGQTANRGRRRKQIHKSYEVI